ncbi:MAG: glycosyltransferase [Chlamydiae bacterium]|nr:MAG: glycosyltransferase [Chlamydiota bacterium]
MKIIHIGKYYFPYARGIETYLKNLCERLIEAVDLEVIVANNSIKTVYEEINGVRVTRLGRLFEFASTSFCFSLPFVIRNKKPDIIHIHLPNPWAELCYFLAGCPGKLVVSFHSDIIRQKFLLKLHSPLHKAFLKRADKIIVATPRHIEFSPFLSKLPKEKFEVVHYGINPKEIQNYDENLKKEIIEKTGKPLILFVGSLVYYKGLEVLIQSIKKSPYITPNVQSGCSPSEKVDCNRHFLLIGSGPLENKLKIMVKKLGVEKFVHFFGNTDHETLKAAYNACDIFVLPSNYRSEAFGIVQLEAFAAGKPVISCDLPSGVPYVNHDGKTGIIVPPNNPAALAAAIKKLLSDDDLRERLGRQARERVEKEFTASQMAVKTLAIYNKLT